MIATPPQFEGGRCPGRFKKKQLFFKYSSTDSILAEIFIVDVFSKTGTNCYTKSTESIVFRKHETTFVCKNLVLRLQSSFFTQISAIYRNSKRPYSNQDAQKILIFCVQKMIFFITFFIFYHFFSKQ